MSVERRAASFLLFSLSGACLLAACSSSTSGPSTPAGSTAEPSEATPTAEPAAEAPASTDDGRGGRLYDKFYARTSFTPDDKKTPGVPDGKGGPFGNGTLPLASGAPLANDGGHDYRAKNFFGWDLRGPAGVAGPKYQDKPGLGAVDLLAPELSDAQIRELFDKGSDTTPGYGAVLSAGELDALITFVLDVRSRKLPRAEDVWTLSETAPQKYTLNAGGDVERGHKLYGERCASCHGADGTDILFDDGEYSLGSHARQKAYEDWFKILNGQPGTSMKRFVRGDAQQMRGEILDLLAALCDREKYPKGNASKDDVPDGDARCGEYLR